MRTCRRVAAGRPRFDTRVDRFVHAVATYQRKNRTRAASPRLRACRPASYTRPCFEGRMNPKDSAFGDKVPHRYKSRSLLPAIGATVGTLLGLAGCGTGEIFDQGPVVNGTALGARPTSVTVDGPPVVENGALAPGRVFQQGKA